MNAYMHIIQRAFSTDGYVYIHSFKIDGYVCIHSLCYAAELLYLHVDDSYTSIHIDEYVHAYNTEVIQYRWICQHGHYTYVYA